MPESSYLELSRTGELYRRAERLFEVLECCTLCPHKCEVNRINGEKGECEAPAELVISSCFPHFGEEPPLVGSRGSGTVFLTFCSLKCSFCQNDSISHGGEGEIFDVQDLADGMLQLQGLGCHNINFVTPTHYVPHIVMAVAIASEKGLSVPLVYNTSGYESVETLRQLDGIIDIYMPDTKFADDKTAGKYTLAENYATIMFKALTEMHRQVGDLRLDGRRIAMRGMIIRHLVMPDFIAGTGTILEFIAEKVGIDSYVNIMDQYRPCCRASDFKEINRPLRLEEWTDALERAGKAGLTRI